VTGKRRATPAGRPGLVAQVEHARRVGLPQPARGGRRAVRGRPTDDLTRLPAPRPAGTRAARRADRREQARRRRRRLTAVATVVALLVVAGVVAGVLASTGRRAPAGAGGPSGAGGAPGAEPTLLLQVTAGRSASGGSPAAASALLGVSAAGRRAAEVLLPAAVLTPAPGAGDSPFGSLLGDPDGVTLSRAALADLLDVRVDGSVVLDPSGLAALVNRLGGVTVRVDSAFTARLPGLGAVAVRAGRQRLDGAQAAAYAVHVGAGEPATADLPRLQGVLDGVAARLPRGAAAVAGLLSRLGPGSVVSGASTPAAAATLAAFAASDRAGHVSYDTLPVVAVDTGAATPAYRVDTASLPGLIHRDLAGAVPPAVFGGFDSVLLEDRSGDRRPIPLLLGARNRLAAVGFRFVGSGSAPAARHARTAVLVPADTATDEAAGDAAAAALGVSRADVQLLRQQQSIADIVVILGSDYHGS
jgi:hypothetical protein